MREHSADATPRTCDGRRPLFEFTLVGYEPDGSTRVTRSWVMASCVPSSCKMGKRAAGSKAHALDEKARFKGGSGGPWMSPCCLSDPFSASLISV